MKVLVQVRTRNLKAPCSTCLGTCGPFCKVGGFSNVLQCTLFLLFCPQQSSGLMEGWIQVSFFLVILEHSGFNMHGKSNLGASLKEKQNLCVS